jgi:hypothetical protein
MSAKKAKKKVDKVKISLTYTWEVTKKEWKEREEFRKGLDDNILWDGVPINKILESEKDNPTYLFHEMNQLGHPNDFKVSVQGIG